MKDKIAIIGGGIAGLTAAYLLNEKYDIQLFEKTDRLGGNAYTYTTSDGIDVDMAVAAFGMAGSKNFYRLVDRLNLKTKRLKKPGISYHNLDSNEGLYLTFNLKGLIKQKFSAFKLKNIKQFRDLRIALSAARGMLLKGELTGITMGECIDKMLHLKGDARMMLIFTLSLAASMHIEQVLEGPAEFFIGKLNKHSDFISPKAFYSIRLMSDKTKSYVDALSAGFINKIIYNSCIRTIVRTDNKITLIMEDGTKHLFDKVVIACNADQALNLLEQPTYDEKNLLGKWRYNNGKVVLHKDYSCFPHYDLIGAYTYLYTDRNGILQTSMNGSVRYEPGVPDDCPLIGSQYPNFPIKNDLIETEKIFRTPIFDFESCSTIKKLPSLNGINNTYYCGAHFGYGIHEDAVTSAIEAAAMLGIKF